MLSLTLLKSILLSPYVQLETEKSHHQLQDAPRHWLGKLPRQYKAEGNTEQSHHISKE